MILYRSVSVEEMALIYDSGMKTFPARLPQQPIFYPVLQWEYARQIASDWNAKNGQLAGYITQFKVEDSYISQFEQHTVGGSQRQEFWIPAEDMEEFNRHIVGQIKVVEAHFGDAFQGFVPDQFGLGGKNAVEQFTVLTNSYIYKRMDFYLEIKRNHKAVFLNYPFWLEYDFKNPGLKEKIIKAIKEAWLTSFPKNPLANPVQEDSARIEEKDSTSSVESIQEDVGPFDAQESRSLLNHVPEEIKPNRRTTSDSSVDPLREDIPPTAKSSASVDRVQKNVTPSRTTASTILNKPVQEGIKPLKETVSPSSATGANAEDPSTAKQRVSHFLQGLELGMNGNYREAIGELTKAVEENPKQVAAHTSLGVAFHRLDEDDRALACYETALNIDPRSAEAHYFRANILYSRGNVREAIAGYTTAIGLKPELIDAYQEPIPQDRLTDYIPSPAEMHWIAKPARRILDLNKLLQTNPGQANLLKERAVQYSRLGNYEQAIADYSDLLAIQPNDASALHSRGVAYEQIGQTDHALEDYQRAITIDPQLSHGYIQRGVALGRAGNFRQSIASLTEGIRLAPQNPDGHFNRGMTYLQLGDFGAAIVDFSMVIQLSSKDEDAYYWRGFSYEEAGRQREAIADYQQFLAISQNSAAREEVEQKLTQWNVITQNLASSGSPLHMDRQSTDQHVDLHELIVAFGERALRSTWFGSDVECYGEKADELYALTNQNRAIEGRDLLDITASIRQTIHGDFTAFDSKDATSHWLLIRAWEGNGFYIEIDDPKRKKLLMTHFQFVEEVDDTSTPYEGLFIRV